MKTALKHIRRFAPWLVTAALFTYLFYQIPPRKVALAFTHVRPLLFASYAVIYFTLILLMDGYSLSRVLSKFCVPVSFKEILPARGVSYLLGLLNYNAGQASLAYFLKRTKNTSFFRALGSLLFVLVIDLYWVVLFAFFGSFFIDLHLKSFDVSDWVQKLALVFFAALLVHLAFWRGWFSRLFKVNVRFRFVDWLRGKHLFQTFHQAKVSDYLKIALLRLPMHAVIISSLYIAVTAFQIHIPFLTILTTVPVILLIGVLPIAPGGLGTVQAATVEFLKDHVSGPVFAQHSATPQEILLAMSLSWMFANYFLKALFGAVCLKRFQPALFKEDLESETEPS
jgi:uncharacterized membrane protein YbhN (UPF0104 family)